MARIPSFVVLLSVLGAAGCRSSPSHAVHSAPSEAPLGVLPEGRTDHPAARRLEPAPALFIPGKAGEEREVFPIAPPPALSAPSIAPISARITGEATASAAVFGEPSPVESVESALPKLYANALKRYATMDTYILRMRRREVIDGNARPEEIMLCKMRKEPFSVYFKWLGTEGKGREVAYVKGQHGNMIHSLTATGDVLFLPGGKRFKVAPDSFLVKSKSRYPITEAGMGSLLKRLGRVVEAVEKGDAREGAVKYLGEVKRPEFETALLGVQQTLPPKADPLLPKGGRRSWFFDPDLGLPVLVIAEDETGREVEYYCHDRFIIPANLCDDDFDPEVLWKELK